VFALIALERKIRKLKLMGDLGLEILQAPNALFTQNDVLMSAQASATLCHKRVQRHGESERPVSIGQSNALIGLRVPGSEVWIEINAGGIYLGSGWYSRPEQIRPALRIDLGVTKEFHLFGLQPHAVARHQKKQWAALNLAWRCVRVL